MAAPVVARAARRILYFTNPADPRSLVAETLEQRDLGTGNPSAPVGMVGVYGGGRGGKSALCNMLSGTATDGWDGGVFRVSSSSEPCTLGVEACLPGEDIEALARRAAVGGRPVIAVSPALARGSVLFCDFEGTGDQGADYSTTLAVPAVCLSPVLLFNSMSGLRRADTLAALVVLASAAERAGGPAGLGHLHIVGRNYGAEEAKGDARFEDAYAAAYLESPLTLLGDEPTDFGGPASQRNEQRRRIRSAFTSVRLWLLPDPLIEGGIHKPIFFRRVGDLLHAVATQVSRRVGRAGGLPGGPIHSLLQSRLRAHRHHSSSVATSSQPASSLHC